MSRLMATVDRGSRARQGSGIWKTPVLGSSNVLARKSCCAGGPRCASCAHENERKVDDVAPPVVHDVLKSSGAPLEGDVTTFMESRFGHRFDHVRVHTDGRAATSARAVGARAYTVGRDIVFGAQQYAPRTPEGRRLLAHELAHVLQQNAKSPSGSSVRMGAADSPLERDADAVANAVAGFHDPIPASEAHAGGATALQREELETGADPNVSGRNDRGGGGSEDKENPCAGWERDPQSFSIKAAQFYAERLGTPGTALDATCSAGPGWTCIVTLQTSSGTLVINVTLAPDDKLVRVATRGQLTCFYGYHCEPTGRLVFDVLTSGPCP